MKPLNEMTFDELATYCQGTIVLAIPAGDFNYAVWSACDRAIQWRDLQLAKKKLEKN